LAVNYTIDVDSIWANNGIINDISIIVLTNIIIPPLANYLNPFALLRILKRRSIVKNPEFYS
jgi:hypothetical protein